MAVVFEVKKADLSHSSKVYHNINWLLERLNSFLSKCFEVFVKDSIADKEIRQYFESNGILNLSDVEFSQRMRMAFSLGVVELLAREYHIWSPYTKIVAEEIVSVWGDKPDWVQIKRGISEDSNLGIASSIVIKEMSESDQEQAKYRSWHSVFPK